jgi:beta-lactamase class D
LPNKQKSAVLTLRISAEEQAELRRAAENRQQSVSEYVRSVVRGDIVAMNSGTSFTSGADTGLTQASATNQGGRWLPSGRDQVVDGTGQTITIGLSRAH